MLKTLRTMAAVGLVAIGVSSCGSGGGDDLATTFCNRSQNCNVLTTSLQECKDIMNQALNNETPSQRADDVALINQCLAYQTCANFETCIANL